MGLPSCTKTSRAITPLILDTSEVWNEMEEPWTVEDVIIAKPGYRWVTRWEEGKNHTVCQFLDERGNLVAVYSDIGSVVTKTPNGYEFDDWYLDVFQPAGERPVLLDEDELQQAVQAGYLTEGQAELARQEVSRVMEQLESSSSDL